MAKKGYDKGRFGLDVYDPIVLPRVRPTGMKAPKPTVQPTAEPQEEYSIMVPEILPPRGTVQIEA